MAKGDVRVLSAGAFGEIGAVKHQVVAGGTPPAINAGEPVAKTLGNQYVTTLATSKPVVGTDFMAGISTTASTETASADGIVYVQPIVSGVTYAIAPKTAANWDTQAEYNALVGARVTLDKTSGVYTINSTDGSTNGCVVENLDITKYPNLVAFSFRDAVRYTA